MSKPPTHEAGDALIAKDPCNNKAFKASFDNAYAYGCTVGHENGLASGYKNRYCNGYNHATALISNNGNLQGNNNDWDSVKDTNDDDDNNDHYGYGKW